MLVDAMLEKMKITTLQWDDINHVVIPIKYQNFFKNKNHFAVYRKLSILLSCSNNGVVKEWNVHVQIAAMRLAIIFGNFDTAVAYLKKIEKRLLTSEALITYVQYLEIPNIDACTMPIWHKLAKKYMPNEMFERIFNYADRLEKYIVEHETTLRSVAQKNRMDQYQKKFSNQWHQITASIEDISQEAYLEKQLSRMVSRIKKEIDKTFRDEMVEVLGIDSCILNDDDKRRILEYVQSSEAIQRQVMIENKVRNTYQQKVIEEFKFKSLIKEQGEMDYVKKQLSEIEKIGTKNQSGIQFDILSPQTDLKTLISYAALAEYQASPDNITSATIFYRHSMKRDDYAKYLTLIPVDDEKKIPDVHIDGESIGYPDVVIEKLNPSDPIAALLGEVTGCCQSLGHAGENPAIHGITSPYGGFYVVRLKKTNDIVAQCWAWRGVNANIVFDSIETQLQFRYEKINMIKTCFYQLSIVLTKKYNVPVVFVGRGGHTPDSFFKVEANNPERPLDYSEDSYRDSRCQFMLSASGNIEKIYLNQLAALAVHLNHIVQLQYYIDQGADISQLLLEAAKLGNEPILRLLLILGADMSIMNVHGLTPIELAAMNKQWDAMRILLDCPNTKDMKSAYSYALSVVAIYNQIDIAELLLKLGADPDSYDSLKKAIISNHKPKAMIDLLISAGADLNRRDQAFNLTPLDIAIKYRKHFCITLLSEYLNLAPSQKTNPFLFFSPPVLVHNSVEQPSTENRMGGQALNRMH